MGLGSTEETRACGGVEVWPLGVWPSGVEGTYATDTGATTSGGAGSFAWHGGGGVGLGAAAGMRA